MNIKNLLILPALLLILLFSGCVGAYAEKASTPTTIPELQETSTCTIQESEPTLSFEEQYWANPPIVDCTGYRKEIRTMGGESMSRRIPKGSQYLCCYIPFNKLEIGMIADFDDDTTFFARTTHTIVGKDSQGWITKADIYVKGMEDETRITEQNYNCVVGAIYYGEYKGI